MGRKVLSDIHTYCATSYCQRIQRHEVYQDEGDKKIFCVDKIEEDYNLVASILTEAITAKSDALGEFLSELRQDVSVKNSKIVASRSSVATFYLDMNNFVEGF